MNIQEFRAQHVEYNDMTDSDLSNALYRTHYSDMPKHNFDLMFMGRPNHDDLESAAVTAADSLELQKLAPETKPVIVGTNQEILRLKQGGKIGRGKVLFLAVPGKAYVIDPEGVQAIYGGSQVGAIKRAKMDILKGNDAHLLGYPEKGPVDVAVNKQGDIISGIPEMVDEAKRGNLAYAASGDPHDLAEKAGDISQAIRTNTPKKWKTLGTINDLTPAVMHEGRKLAGGNTHDEILDYHGVDRAEGERLKNQHP
jgi:hypothetical protein